jgi:hypothetical protein
MRAGRRITMLLLSFFCLVAHVSSERSLMSRATDPIFSHLLTVGLCAESLRRNTFSAKRSSPPEAAHSL